MDEQPELSPEDFERLVDAAAEAFKRQIREQAGKAAEQTPLTRSRTHHITELAQRKFACGGVVHLIQCSCGHTAVWEQVERDGCPPGTHLPPGSRDLPPMDLFHKGLLAWAGTQVLPGPTWNNQVQQS